MKSSRIALTACAALVTVATLAGSAMTSPAAAGGLGLDWLSNDNYVRCLKYVRGLSNGDEAAYNRGRKACNRQYYPNTPGVDH